jgi:NAD(P)-dependent dehydrogenase (short-subunit alcohol dehydrogenase family)
MTARNDVAGTTTFPAKSSSTKVVLVTGGSSGLGKSICLRLAKARRTVFGTSRKANGQQVDGYTLITMDVCDATSFQGAADAVIAANSRLDVLVNNARLGIQVRWRTSTQN